MSFSNIKKYNMDQKERGVALVINMQKYDPAPDQRNQLEERAWSIKDVENLKNTLEYLEFDFKLLQDLRADQIRSNMQALAKYVDFTNSDCFLCVVMSHGNHEKIVACDNKEISFEDIMTPIKSCKSLINKPKLFFFQSCRGNNQMETITTSSSSKTSTEPLKKTDENSTEKTKNISIIEYESDLFIFYSTLPNHLSFALADFKEGTCFVKCVCDVLSEAYKNLPNNLSLSQMVTRINEKVKEDGMKWGERLQLTDPRTTLTKELYFMPKNMLHAEWIVFLKRENKSKDFDQVKNYYMPRKLRRFIQIEKKILEPKKGDNFDFVIVQTEEDFKEKCRQNPQMKNIHYLIKHNQNENLLWQMSSGPLSKLNQYLIRKEVESIDEEDLFHKNNEKIFLISADPGMGKSLILDHYTYNSSAENFFLKIILNTCTKSLSDLKNKKKTIEKIDDLMDFVLQSLLNKNDELEISLFKHLAKEEKLTLMFDGLDEVTDYKEQVIQLIDALRKNYVFKKILITTRNHLKEELEDHFRTFSFNLNNFDGKDQKNFLVKYWRNLSGNKDMNDEKITRIADGLITSIKSSLTEKINQLIGIPLQTKMLGDIYYERINENGEKIINLGIANIAELYNQFIETKIRIQYEEKTKIEIERDQDRFEEEKEKFYDDHIKLASSILQILPPEFKERDERRIVKYGVILAFTNKSPTFLHQSFAEFFVAKNSLQKIEQNKEENDKVIEEIFSEKRHFLVRKFLNDLMDNGQEFVQKQTENNKKDDFTKGIENCCRENLLFLLKYFIQKREANLNVKNNFLVIASSNGLKEIVLYLLKQGINLNQQDNRGYSALMVTSFSGQKEISKLLLEHKDINVNQQNKSGTTALMLASHKGHKEIVQLLLQIDNLNCNHQNMSGNSALSLAATNGQKEVVQLLLENEKINVNQHEKNVWTAFYFASKRSHKEIVEILLQNKNLDINRQNDLERSTALMAACEEGHKEIVQMLLDHKDIQIDQENDLKRTALMLATQNGHEEIVEMLLLKYQNKLA